MSSRLRISLGIAVSALLLVVAVMMPTAWYDALPRRSGLPPFIVRGTTLLRVMLGVQALIVAVVVLRGWRWIPIPANARAFDFSLRAEPNDLTVSHARVGVCLITVLALALRVYHIDSDLWLDELFTLTEYARRPLAEIIGSYRTSNNHLLISLLMKASIAAFGEHEWTVRLAVVALGTASIPAVYQVARLVMSRRSSMGAALLLAVSYHHVFFSQNARGYVVYVLFALIGTRALLDALRDDRAAQWVRYGAATVLGFLALLNTMFVVAAQLVVVATVVLRLHRRSVPVGPLVRRATGAFAVIGFLCIEAYAVALPEVYAVITTDYTKQGTGFSPTSSELLFDLIRGVTDGFGMQVWIAAVPFLALAAGGLFVLWRRQWAVTALLLLPGVLTAALLASLGMTFTPRYFLLWLPLAAMTAVLTIDATTQRLRTWSPRRRQSLASTIVAALAVVSALSLRRYYVVPKQPYVATLRYVERVRRPDHLVVAIHHARTGIQYYGARRNVALANNYAFVETESGLDSALALRAGRRVLLITTLERVLAHNLPRLKTRVTDGWQRDTTFAATIGGGQLSVWSEKLPRVR